MLSSSHADEVVQARSQSSRKSLLNFVGFSCLGFADIFQMAVKRGATNALVSRGADFKQPSPIVLVWDGS